MPELQTRDADLAVIGAGLAGLSAARLAAAAGASVVVVEARDRVGGRVLNEEIGGGNVVEVGGQWIGPTQDRLAALAGELGVATFPTYGDGENVIEYGGRRPGRGPRPLPPMRRRRPPSVPPTARPDRRRSRRGRRRGTGARAWRGEPLRARGGRWLW